MSEKTDPILEEIAKQALAFVEDKSTVGLGSGRAATAFIRALGERYRAGLRVRGDKLEASVDGQPILTASDATLASGQAGVYGFANGGLTFDNFTVQALSAGNQ